MLDSLLGLETLFTSIKAEFTAFDGPRIAYCVEGPGQGLHFQSHEMMFEKGVREMEVPLADTAKGKVPFPYDGDGPMPFDIFASSFYLLSRYEEYLPFKADVLGRFTSDSSLANKLGSLEVPLVEYWVRSLAELLEQSFPGIHLSLPEYRFIPTYDIDVSYAYRGRPLWRTGGGYLRSAAFGRMEEIRRRAKVLRGHARDPYDVFQLLEDWHRSFNLEPVFFFLVGKRGRLDKNLDPRNRQQATLIRGISQVAKTGLHPSFASNQHPQRLRKEKALLEEVSGFRVRRSRQHYLILNFPGTYRGLIDAGILEDHTMGFADKPGYRAGTSRPFPFYDLEREKETPLLINPFAVMDGSLREYMHLSPEEGLEIARRIIDNTRQAGGVFSTLWHNSSLSDQQGWKGWRGMYQQLLEEAK